MGWYDRLRLQRALDRLARAHLERGTFSGAVLVARGDEVLLRRGYGLAQAELGVANTPETLFRIGSVAKTFTALTVMRLAEAGRLDPDDPVASYLPDFPRATRLRLHHLLSNSSGVADYLMLPACMERAAMPHSLDDLLAYAAAEPPLFEPGERLGYSNSNWALLARVVERVTDQPFGEALDAWLLRPAGLSKTFLEDGYRIRPGRASGYSLDDGTLVNARPIDPSVETGAGGLRSTVDDLHRLDRALARDTLVSPATLARMTTPVARDDTLAYGYGFFIDTRFGRRMVGHSGGTLGFTAFFIRFPDDDAVVVVLSNLDNGSAERLERDLGAALFGAPYQLPGEPVYVEVPVEILAGYQGTYRSEFAGRPIEFAIRLRERDLYAEFPLLPKARLRAVGPTRFLTRIKGGEVTVEFAEEVPPPEVRMEWSGMTMRCPRLDREAQ